MGLDNLISVVLRKKQICCNKHLKGSKCMNINPFRPIRLISPIRNFCLLLGACRCLIILIIKYFL